MGKPCHSGRRAGVGGSADLRSFSTPKVPHFLRKRVSPSPASLTRPAFSAWLEEQLRLKQTFPQIGSNKVKASPRNTFGLVPSAPPPPPRPRWVNFPGRSTWFKKRKKKVCKHVRASPLSYMEVQHKHMCSCTLGKFKRSARKGPLKWLRKNRRSKNICSPQKHSLWSACQVCFPWSAAK